MRRVYVGVTAYYDTDGMITPLSVTWDDGRMFEIDCVLDVRKAASLKTGGVGVRYICRVRGKELYLYFDVIENKWFAEGK